MAQEETPPAAALELSLRAADAPSLVGLELPFYAARVSRVLETVGGAASLQQAHESHAQFLPVKLRPSEPSCKPLFADLAKTQSVLLRVRRRRHTSDANSASSSSNSGDAAVEAEVVGLVREKYVCEGMADFQYFTSRTFHGSAEDEARAQQQQPPTTESDPQVSETWQREPATGALCVASPAQVALKASLRPYLRVRSERELEMIPEVFSKVDLPLKYEFRQRSGYQPTEKAKKTSSTMTYLNFYDDVAAPVEPKPENPSMRRRPVGAGDAVDDHVLRVLQAKLAEKPVWLRSMLFVGLDFLERRAARRLLRKLCYVFVDGPWRGSWIRMGYDPRKAPESAKYQVIELRNNRELVHAKVTHPSRKRTKKSSGANPKGPRIAKVTQTSENENAQASKRRRKERFLLSDTRRAYLADAQQQQFQQKQQQQQQESAGYIDDADRGVDSDGDDDLSNEWDSDQDGDDGRDGVNSGARGTLEEGAAAAAVSEGGGGPGFSTSASGERTFTIFGVPLTSANVLFQLDDIDDEEVLAWTAQFAPLDKPTLLGGWYSTHMFLPLRELIRLRIATLVGRSKADLDLRRKRIDALKKQALADYANGSKESAKEGENDGEDGAGTDEGAVEARAEALAQAAFEESLVRERTEVQDATSGDVGAKVPTAVGELDENMAGSGDVDDHSLDLNDEDEIREDEEEEAAVEALARQQERLERGGRGGGSDDVDDEEDDDIDASEEDERGDKRGVLPATKDPEPAALEAVTYSF